MAILNVIKCEAPVHTLVWKHPAEDFNTSSTLIVDESQAAVLYKNGQVADVFTAGRHVLATQNIPLLRKLIELPTGGISTFSCKVYFVNLVEAMNLKWGLNSRVTYMEPVYQIPVAIGMRGALSIRVGDPGHLIINLVGTEHGLTAEGLTDYFRSLIVMRVKSYVTKVITEQQLNIFTINSELEVLADALKARIASDLEPYGIRLNMFTVDEVIQPEDDPLYIRVKRSLSERSTGLFEAETKRQAARIAAQANAETEVIGAQGHKAALDTLGTSYQQERQFDISETMAANPGVGGFSGMAGGMAMIPGAIAMGNMAAGIINAGAMNFTPGALTPDAASPAPAAPGTVSPAPTAPAPDTVSPAPAAPGTVSPAPAAPGTVSPAPTAPAPDTVSPAPAAPGTVSPAPAAPAGTKKCANCGAEIQTSMKFCPQCGQPQARVCPNCGLELPAGTNFCPECGTKL